MFYCQLFIRVALPLAFPQHSCEHLSIPSGDLCHVLNVIPGVTVLICFIDPAHTHYEGIFQRIYIGRQKSRPLFKEHNITLRNCAAILAQAKLIITPIKFTCVGGNSRVHTGFRRNRCWILSDNEENFAAQPQAEEKPFCDIFSVSELNFNHLEVDRGPIARNYCPITTAVFWGLEE